MCVVFSTPPTTASSARTRRRRVKRATVKVFWRVLVAQCFPEAPLLLTHLGIAMSSKISVVLRCGGALVNPKAQTSCLEGAGPSPVSPLTTTFRRLARARMRRSVVGGRSSELVGISRRRGRMLPSSLRSTPPLSGRGTDDLLEVKRLHQHV